MSELKIWMNGELVGTWAVSKSGLNSLVYAQSWMESRRGRALSLSLPFTPGNRLEGDVVTNYFDNLLPDAEGIRKRIQSRYRIKGAAPIDLLKAIGRDCVGAVQLLPTDVVPDDFRKIEAEPLSDQDIEEFLKGLGGPPVAGAHDDDDFRISIAGAQEKTALTRFDEQWCRPHGATPTTHILKPQIGVTPTKLDLSHSVENEWLCNQVMKELGFNVAGSDMETFGSQRVLVVTRFDRDWLGNHDGSVWIARLPQEDLCQARGISSAKKYERDDGPGIRECLDVLKSSVNFPPDGLTFLRAQLLFWFLAATDGHAKNFSLRILPGGHFIMTPIYDVLSAWPILDVTALPSEHTTQPYKKVKMAMSVRSEGGKKNYRLAEMQYRHWKSEAEHSGIPGAWDEMLLMVDEIGPALQRVEQSLPPGFPESVSEPIFMGTRMHLERFMNWRAS